MKLQVSNTKFFSVMTQHPVICLMALNVWESKYYIALSITFNYNRDKQVMSLSSCRFHCLNLNHAIDKKMQWQNSRNCIETKVPTTSN